MQKAVYEFISKTTNDPIVEWRTCAVSGKEFPIFQSDKEFLEKISPTFGGVKYPIPSPALCPEERQRRRMSRRNDNILYRRKCDFTGKNIVSTFSPDHTSPVYGLEARFSDEWDRLQYGRDFDFSKTFFEQFDALNQVVPKAALIYDNNVNCEYTNGVGDSKNCYLVFGGTACEDCMYGRIYESKNCVDGFMLRNAEHCYECIDSSKLYNCQYCQDCNNSSYLQHCKYVDNSNNCFGCVGLKNQSYHIFNQKYTKEEYQTKINEVRKMSLSEVENNVQELEKNTVKASVIGYGNEKVIGNYCFNSKACTLAFDIGNTENGRHISYCTGDNDVADIDYGEYSNHLYEMCGFYRFSKSAFCSMNWPMSDNLYYCYMSYLNNHHCFGCIGIKNNQYCIFNKQYTKAEYEKLVPKIIEHMQKTGERGNFFPVAISPYGYNETTAQEYYPLSPETCKQKNYKRMSKEYPLNIPEGIQMINADDLPNLIADVGDDILNKAIVCKVSGRPFRIVRQELDFYRRHGIPLPKKHPEVRNKERLAKRPGRELCLITCAKCGTQTLSIHKKDNVYCENCYNKEVYG